MFTINRTGVVYRNPLPHLQAVHAWHPTLVTLDDGTWVAAFDRGQAVESLDYRTWITRSRDEGQTWSDPRPLIEPNGSDTVPSNDLIRIRRLRSGRLLGCGGRLYRDRPDEGFVNRAQLGYVRMDLITLESDDGGETWSAPRILSTPLPGPFEICHAVVELRDGRLLFPTSTWKAWDGSAPNGMQAIVLISHDQGRTWPEWRTVIDEYRDGIISWEIGLTPLADDRLLAVVWSLDEAQGKSRPNQFALATPQADFAPPHQNGLVGETAKLLTLADGRVLCAYRRTDEPGLWGALVEIQDNAWVTQQQIALWQGAKSGMVGAQNAADELSDLRFGFPSMTQLPEGDVIVVFWCLEGEQRIIRWVRLNVNSADAN